MDFYNKWENLNWTIDARKLLLGLQEFPKDSKIILLLRHSERNEPKSVWDTNELLLTPDGHKMAKKFGENLPLDRNINIFYSLVTRCRETAEDILESFSKCGGNGELKGSLDPLYKIGVERNFFLEQIEDGELVKYIQNWITGSFPKEKAQSIMSYSINAAKVIWTSINHVPNRFINIYVTHEIPIMGLRYGWFNLLPNDKWVNFLSGFAFVFLNEKILLYDIDRFLTVEIPSWWKK